MFRVVRLELLEPCVEDAIAGRDSNCYELVSYCQIGTFYLREITPRHHFSLGQWWAESSLITITAIYTSGCPHDIYSWR